MTTSSFIIVVGVFAGLFVSLIVGTGIYLLILVKHLRRQSEELVNLKTRLRVLQKLPG